ncbi:MAG: hypothetical protein K8R37_11720, partial [Bacteroidales bacterium]|nr:hypothetical protein [Bacteroidales bacterium]
ISQPQLTWQFANYEVINAGTQLQFDVEVKADIAGSFHRDLQVYFDYNTAGFGSDIVANGKIAVSNLTLMNTHYAVVNMADNTSSKFAIISEADEEMNEPGSATYYNEVTTTFQGLFRFTIDILSNTETAGIVFDAALMNGGQYYQSTSNTDPVKYVNPSLYDNDLSTDLLSTLYGVINYDNTANTLLNGAEATLYSGVTPIDVAIADITGTYYFSGMADGSYTIETTCSKPWGGVTTVDGILAKRFALGLLPLTPLRQLAADVNLAGGVTTIDGILIQRRALGLLGGWPAPDYVFEVPNPAVTSGIGTANYEGLCSGDVNGSYTPPAD